MKRYKLHQTVERHINPSVVHELAYRSIANLVEDPNGEYVRFDEVDSLVKMREEQTLEGKLKRLERQLFETLGFCSDCGEKVGGWKPVFGAFAPEWWATMKEKGIDGGSGHKISCKRATK